MSKLQAAILFGGANSEYQVSLMSATSVLKNIPRDRYDVTMLGITEDGRWLEYTGPIELITNGQWAASGQVTPAFISPDRSIHGMVILGPQGAVTRRIDVAFPVMHGRFAEDGTMQGLMALAGIPCVGPGTCASAICMDKQYTHMVLDGSGITTARWLAVHREDCDDSLTARICEKLGGYPVFVKPANAGSSVGVSKAIDDSSLRQALELAFQNDGKVLIEEAVVGKEIECAVMGNDRPVASDFLGEIVPKVAFYDYQAKYFDDSTDLYIPARICEEDTQRIRSTAVAAYKALGCKGLTRVDFFLKADGTIVLNEPNTLPGFTSISMYPKLFIASGIPYGELIDKLLTLAMEQ